MGRREYVISALKKVISCGSSHRKKKRNHQSKKWMERQRSPDLDSYGAENTAGVPLARSPVEEVKLMEAENEQNRHAYSVAIATAVAAEAAVAAAQAAAEVVRLTAGASSMGKTKEELAAIRIQTAFRGHLARRALIALRGLVRLKSLIEGQSVQRQSEATLKRMQTMARLQFEVRSRRVIMSEESSALHRQIQQKREKELEKQRASIGENWDDTTRSREQIEADIQNRHEAAVRRERALAYAFSHQQTWRNSPFSSTKQTFMDPNNPRWGWSWLDRWMTARAWDDGSTTDKDKDPNNDSSSVKSSASHPIPIRGEIKTPSSKPRRRSRSHSRPPSRQSPSTPVSSKISSSTPRGLTNGKDDDTKSNSSVQSDRCRRHSFAGSSVRDDESISSLPTASQGYMASTVSARAKSRPPSPLGTEKNGTGGSAKKRLSFSESPSGPRRHSGSAKVDMSPIKGSAIQS